MISIIVPAFKGLKKETKEAIQEQSFKDFEIIEVVGVSPNGRARNEGVKKAKGDIFVFIDDDSLLGHRDVLKTMISYLGQDNIEIVGASRLLPKDANWFSKRVASQVPMVEIPVARELTDATPPLKKENSLGRFFKKSEGQKNWSPISTSCLAITREAYEKIGGFDENLWWGVDTEFLYRGAQKNIVMKLAPEVWIYHPYASNLKKLWKKYFKSGLGTAHEMKLNPERKLKPALASPLVAFWFIFYRSLASFGLFFIKPFRAMSTIFSAYGYVYGWYASRDKVSATEDNKVVLAKETSLYFLLVLFSIAAIISLFCLFMYIIWLLIKGF
jgi:GT2 family glycosyltransferase